MHGAPRLTRIQNDEDLSSAAERGDLISASCFAVIEFGSSDKLSRVYRRSSPVRWLGFA